MKYGEGPKSNTYELMGLEREDISLIHDKAKAVLREGAFKETDFIGNPYERETVERDIAYVERERARIAKESREEDIELRQLATIFEAIVLENGELSEWFGDNAFTLATSEYDDLQGVDMVVEFREGASASYLGLAADVTFSGSPNSSNGVGKKFDRLLARIEKGNLPQVKYFKSQHIPIRGSLQLPEVIIGVEKATVLELAELWVAKKKRILETHRVQIMILEQIRDQIRFFANYARSVKRDRIAAIYEMRLASVEDILRKKADIARVSRREGREDRVHSQIIEFIKLRQAGLGSEEATDVVEDLDE
ncbi:MAG: hypothetical protein A2741_01200 [Candidatus Zambryskibacteria bacterium RIFCSPHIGHO2_01_FULL_43_27]|uniref:Uncharacterized protein n=1 Tax=Candidatus Zambryskibacteria bacterium RIFCSPLOWO2_01_FULL_43_17 TaxID=1802760 RepID=A0A1G2U198_9BACT|nr:MAG: hypothetical protein A2741_01200 [Candidatus Zambryskibacteria bacterium RIFCSPHIGHO2_01_FULL_43_27]OHA99870.1 MAG: hypothetical protein A3E93_02190 [Candidatus Zambryskibacteria bacterium RIFCSPHIGHO2_12_FULL_43_12b]OHB03306.1 MAG: hypothetical protein A2920_01055 [Candidatus Zambryskibacteria bacterium RIFCSPLOWO2_01_FULL_43_17]